VGILNLDHMNSIFRLSGVTILIMFILSCKEKTTLPVISTTEVTDISYTTATSGGEVTNEGGDPVTIRGICWNTSEDPTISDSKTNESGGLGTFTSQITWLTPNTTYFVRAYATNSSYTGYGNQVSFNTITPRVPSVTTATTTSITATTALSGGKIVSSGSDLISANGVCWSTTPNPTVSLTTITGANFPFGTFISSITNLTANTTYFVRAYATNMYGTGYGNEETFTTNNVIAKVPGPPTGVIATAGYEQASIYFQPPADNGGASITGYTVTSNPGNITISVTNKNYVTVTGLTNGTTYTFTVSATNGIGTGSPSSASNSVTPTSVLAIGLGFQGGKIAYILKPGDPGYISGETHGIIVAIQAQKPKLAWGNGSSAITGATATTMGTGKTNTNTIVTSQGEGNYAAKWCYDLIWEGYSDWYLPSKDELDKLYLSQWAWKGYDERISCWSSSEFNYLNFSGGWSQNFGFGHQYESSKTETLYVNAVRSF
jgi:hypothetical protein